MRIEMVAVAVFGMAVSVELAVVVVKAFALPRFFEVPAVQQALYLQKVKKRS